MLVATNNVLNAYHQDNACNGLLEGPRRSSSAACGADDLEVVEEEDMGGGN